MTKYDHYCWCAAREGARAIQQLKQGNAATAVLYARWAASWASRALEAP
jgi:hypothetical protein